MDDSYSGASKSRSTPSWRKNLLISLIGIALLGVDFMDPDSIHKNGGALAFGSMSLKIEYATTPEAREKGLGGRLSLPQDSGMLFIFPKEDSYGFWMKDMHFPIDIFWMDSQGQVVFIEKSADPSTYPNVFYPDKLARYVLETNAGFAEKYQIKLGTQFELKNIPSVSK